MVPLRCYTVSFAASAQTAAIDFFELITGTGGAIALLGLEIGQSTELGDAQEEKVRLKITRATGSYTSGSGGNTGVARPPVRAGEAAATFTAETLNTTQIAVGSGTLTVMSQYPFEVRAGYERFWTPETAFTAGPSSALAIGLAAAPADSVTWEGTAYVAELSA
jgi:hypothetical protein